MKQKTRKQRYREITSAADKELNATVVELAEVYLKDFPDSQGAWSMYSFALYRTDRIKDAKKALHKLLKLTGESDENFSWYLCRMGRIYEDSGHFHKAIEWFHKAHLANPLEATFLIYKGVLFLRTEKYDEASKTLIEATKCSEGCIEEAFYNLGVVRIAQKRYEEALVCFENAIEIDRKYKEAKQQFKDMQQVLSILKNQIPTVGSAV